MSSKTFSLGALALSAALTSNPVLAQQNSASMTQNQIHDRVMELCKSPDSGKNIVNGTKEICDEYSTDGGKTWIKAVGGASILAAISVGALIRIRKRKEEKEKIEDNSVFEIPESSTNLYHDITTGEERDPGDDEDGITHNGDTIETDPIAESDVYATYGRYEQAIDLLAEELRKNPENEQAYIKLAKVYSSLSEDAKVNLTSKTILSNLESSLSESELKKLIETANTGSIPKKETITEEGDTIEMDEGFRLGADWGNDFRDTEKYMKMVEHMYKRGSKERFNQFYESTRKLEEAGFFKLSESELSKIKTWGRELDPENPIYRKDSSVIEGHFAKIDNVPETILITHDEINPHLITPSENIIPTQVIEEKAPIHAKFTPKNQGKLGIDKVVTTRLNALGFSINKSEDGESAIIVAERQGVTLHYFDKVSKTPKTVKFGETYTITDATGIFFTNREKIPTILIRWKDGKQSFVQIIVEKEEVPPSK